MSGSGATNLPLPNTPFLDGHGNVTLVWRRVLLALLNRTGGTTASANALLNGNSNQSFAVQTATLPTEAISLGQYRSEPGQTPTALGVGASPWTFSAPSNGCLILDGGSVSNVEYQRNGVQAQIGNPPEIVPMRVSDQIILTFSLPPNAVWFPN